MKSIISEGLVAGLFGAVAVAVVFLVYDVSTSEVLRTPSTLQALFFEGPGTAHQAETSLQRALLYTVVHLGAWLVVGVASAYLAAATERFPSLWYALVVGVAALICALLWAAGVWQVPGLGYHHLWVGALVGGAALGSYLLRRHPKLLHHLPRA